jgi:hypothetical protein
MGRRWLIVPFAAFAVGAIGSAVFIVLIGEGSLTLAVLLIGLLTATFATVYSVSFALVYAIVQRLLGSPKIALVTAAVLAAVPTVVAVALLIDSFGGPV